MAKIQVGEESSTAIHIQYEDRGSGRPVVLEGSPRGLRRTHGAAVGEALLRFPGHDRSSRRVAAAAGAA